MNYQVNNKYKPLLYLIDLIGNLFFFSKKFKKLKIEEVKNIAVIRLDHIGDSILTFPFFDNLRKEFPKAKITVITRPANKDILEYNKSIDEIITINPPWFSRSKKRYSELLRFARDNYKQFDLLFELHSDPRNILLASLISKFSVGYGIRGFGFLLNRVVEYVDEKKHMIQRNLDILEGIGMKTYFSYPSIKLQKEETEKAKKPLINNFINQKIVCVSVGAGRKDKYWLNEKWAKLCNILMRDYGATIIFTGDAKEEKNIAEIKNKLNSNKYVDLCSKTNLKKLCAIIKNCKLVISPDSAPIHIAKALSISSIALFNKEDPLVWGYGDKNVSVFKAGIEKVEVEDVIYQINDLKLLC